MLWYQGSEVTTGRFKKHVDITRAIRLEVDVDGRASNVDETVELVVAAADRLLRALGATANANTRNRAAVGTNFSIRRDTR